MPFQLKLHELLRAGHWLIPAPRLISQVSTLDPSWETETGVKETLQSDPVAPTFLVL